MPDPIPSIVLFTIPSILNIPGAGKLPPGTLTRIGPPKPPTPEPGAWGHWFLSESDASLKSLIPLSGGADNMLTPQADGRIWSNDGVYLPARGKALVSGFPDKAVQTYWMVVKRYDVTAYGGSSIYAGSSNHTNDGGSNISSRTNANPNDLAGTIRVGISRIITMPSGINPGDWMFIALSERFETTPTLVRKYCLYIGGASNLVNIVVDASITKTVVGRNLALGSAYNSSAPEGPNIGVTAREFGIFDGFKTKEELDAIYLNSKDNNARSGVLIY